MSARGDSGPGGLRAVWHGLITPSPPATGLMLAVAGSIWALLWFGVGPEQVAAHAPYLAEDAKDTYAFTTGRLARLDELCEPGAPTVVLTGASGLRYALAPIWNLDRELALAVDGARVIDLMTDDQSVLETLAILALLPERFDGIVIVGLNPVRWSRPTALPDPHFGFVYRLGVRSPFLAGWQRARGDEPEPAHSFFWDNRAFLLPRLAPLVRNALGQPPAEYVPPPENPNKVGEHRWAGFVGRLDGIDERFAEYGPENLAQLARAGADLAARTAGELVLLEAPLSPRAAAAYGPEFLAHWQRRIADFADEQGWPYWDLQAAAGLDEPDFFDWMHLRHEDARGRFRAALVERLVERLAQR